MRKAGEIIPEVVRIESHLQNTKCFEMPKYCPSCGSKVVREDGEAVIRCTNTSCPAQLLRHLIHFVSRNAMEIDGLGESLLEQLVKEDLVISPADIYELKAEQLEKIERMGKKSANNVINAIEASKSSGLDKLLFALGIRHVGQKAAKLLSERFRNIDDLFVATEDEISLIDGLGPVIAKSVVEYFSLPETKQLIEKLRQNGVNLDSKVEEAGTKFLGQTFVLTGTLSSYTRDSASKIIEKLGGKVTSSVSKKQPMF